MAEDNRQNDNGQGGVNHPETDKRLKENGGGEQGQGKVTNPETDGRLKDKRS